MNATNKRGHTALMEASLRGYINGFNVLLKAGADPSITDANGNICLHYSVQGGCGKVVLETTFNHGDHVNATNRKGHTALMMACEKGSMDYITALIEAGADPNSTDVNGETYLHHSVRGGCSKEVLHIINDHGAHVNATNNKNQTALMLGTMQKNKDCINVLLKAGSNPNITDVDGNTCLQSLVVHECNIAILQAIIDHDAHVNATNKRGHSALMMASVKGNIDAVNVLLKAGADPDITDANGNTCIHLSMYEVWKRKVLQTLIDHGANVNATDKDCQTALVVASDKGNTDAINVLLTAGADPNIADANGNTCLHFAVHQGCNKEVVQMIIDHGAHVNIANKNGLTALMIACERGNIDVINVLLEAGSDPDITDASGNTCLQCSVLQGCSIEVLQTIIDHGAQVNATNKNGQTALMMASDCGYLNGINMLLRAGADPNVINANGSTCLHFASRHGSSKEALQTIIDHGVNVNATNKKGHTALMMASEFGHLNGIHVLLKAGAQPNITDVYGNTCLHFPVIQGRRIEVLEAIIDHGVDVNASTKKGQTALMIATEKGNIDAINVLKAGADPNITNADGNTCLHLSILHGCRKEVVQMIIDHGAHVNATNKNGLTALMIASCRGNVDGVNALLKTGANHYITDADGNTCLHYSISGKWRREVLEMIIDHGAHVNDTGENGHTALMMACVRGNIDGINLLLKAGADVNISCAKGNICLHH